MNDWFSTIAVSAVTLGLIYTYFSSSKKKNKVRTHRAAQKSTNPLSLSLLQVPDKDFGLSVKIFSLGRIKRLILISAKFLILKYNKGLVKPHNVENLNNFYVFKMFGDFSTFMHPIYELIPVNKKTYFKF